MVDAALASSRERDGEMADSSSVAFTPSLVGIECGVVGLLGCAAGVLRWNHGLDFGGDAGLRAAVFVLLLGLELLDESPEAQLEFSRADFKSL